MMTAAHGDSPAFKIKENAELSDGNYLRLSVEKYGGMLCAPWLDRPLSVAGRVLVSEGDKLSVKLVDLKDPCAIIPNVAIHMNRNANDGMSYNAAVDMLPVWMSSEKGSFRAAVAQGRRCCGGRHRHRRSFPLRSPEGRHARRIHLRAAAGRSPVRFLLADGVSRRRGEPLHSRLLHLR